MDNDGFRYLLHILEPKYVLPTRKHLTEVIVPNTFNNVRDFVKDSLASEEKVALTCDSWTSRNMVSYLTITAHYISNWSLQSHVLQTRAIQVSHTASNLADLLTEAIKEWELTEKHPAFVTDNAPNMVNAVGLMGCFHLGCFAPILNLASQAGLKIAAVSHLLARVRRITSFVRQSPTASLALKSKQKLLQLPEHKLVTDVVTRWNSSLEMLEKFLEQQPAVSAALLSPEVRRKESDISTLTKADITLAEDVVKVLQPLRAAHSGDV